MAKSSLLAVLIVLGALPAQADVKLPAIFGDHMVLQQDGKIPVWGWADAGEKVSVAIGSDKADTTGGADGKWRVDLAPMPTTATGVTMTVTGKNTLTFQDVLVGEVWLASGQSNMELKMNAGLVTGQDAIAQSANPQIRLFTVDKVADLTPQEDVKGSWKICGPDTVGSMSAVAYFFGRELQQKLQRPVGLLESDWGGTAIESWMSIETLGALPFTKGGVDNTQKRKDAEPKSAADRAKAQADFQAALADWKKNVDDPFQPVIRKWYADRDAAKKAGQPEPPPPHEASNHPNSPLGEMFEYTTLFNGMIAPIIPYAMRGAIWYQGESNSGGDGLNYDVLLKTMITDWRARWNEGDFPFLVVGLANCDARYPFPVDSGWAGVRYGQAQVTDTLPNTGLAEAIDIGEAHNIHPLDKLDLSRRLAADALAIAYKQNVPYQGPRFDSMKVDGGTLRVTYKDTGAGLTIGQPPVDYQTALAAHKLATDDPLPPTDKLVGFAIAGADKKWVFADAKIDGNDVVLSSPQVPNPVAARYGWANNPQVNLYNKDGFPAVPFRTDDWGFVAPPPNPNP
jgi:sialate O-acetylesterase